MVRCGLVWRGADWQAWHGMPLSGMVGRGEVWFGAAVEAGHGPTWSGETRRVRAGRGSRGMVRPD